MHCSAAWPGALCLLRCPLIFYAKALFSAFLESVKMSRTHSYSLARTSIPAQKSSATRSSVLAIAPGQAQWLYLEAGSSQYCSAGAVTISSPWHSALALAAEQAPHCNGAQAGWYWLEARSADGAQVQVSHQAHAGWQSAWQAVASWLGWQD